VNIDTHRHLGGCIPHSWVWQTIKERGLWFIAESEQEVHDAMCFALDEPWGFHRFLDKFRILDKIKWDEELIDSSIAAVCKGIIAERLDYCWLNFSINKYMESMNWHKKDAIKFVYEAFKRYCPNKVGLILSLKYESTRASQRQYAKLIYDPDVFYMLFGLDLVGDEAYFDYEFYRSIFRVWNAAGKMTRAHVAESQKAENGLHAITHLGVSNIAHGIKMVEHPDMIALARDRGVTFDLGISSNYLTGVWVSKSTHPLTKMLDHGLNVTIGTDDPVQCGCTLHNEYEQTKKFGITDEQRQFMRLTAEKNTRIYAAIS
jgi:adenosine deaminase